MTRLVCPAAVELEGAVGAPSVLCGELHRANTRGSHVSPVMDGDHDRSAIGAYCMGPGVPGSVNAYTACPIWVAAREADWAARSDLRDEQAERPPEGLREQLARA